MDVAVRLAAAGALIFVGADRRMSRPPTWDDARGPRGTILLTDTSSGRMVVVVTDRRSSTPHLEEQNVTLAKTHTDVTALLGAVVVGTDGSCVSNPGPTGWAYVADDGSSGCGGLLHGTNNIGELLAVANALRDFADRPLVIQADSAYTIGCSTTWAAGWARNGWMNSKKEIVANVEIVQGIYALMQTRRETRMSVFFQKVKAHLVDLTVWPLNVAADDLAGRASARAARGDVAEVRTVGATLF